MYSFSSLVSHQSLLTKSGKTCENLFLNLYLVVGSWTHREKGESTPEDDDHLEMKKKQSTLFVCV